MSMQISTTSKKKKPLGGAENQIQETGLRADKSPH